MLLKQVYIFKDLCFRREMDAKFPAMINKNKMDYKKREEDLFKKP